MGIVVHYAIWPAVQFVFCNVTHSVLCNQARSALCNVALSLLSTLQCGSWGNRTTRLNFYGSHTAPNQGQGSMTGCLIGFTTRPYFTTAVESVHITTYRKQ